MSTSETSSGNQEITPEQQIQFIEKMVALKPLLDSYVKIGDFMEQPDPDPGSTIPTETTVYFGYFRLDSGWLARVHIQEQKVDESFAEYGEDPVSIAGLTQNTLLGESYNLRVPQAAEIDGSTGTRIRRVDAYQINRLQHRGVGTAIPKHDREIWTKSPTLDEWYEVFGSALDDARRRIDDLIATGEIDEDERGRLIFDAHLRYEAFEESLGNAPEGRFTSNDFETTMALISQFGPHTKVELE